MFKLGLPIKYFSNDVGEMMTWELILFWIDIESIKKGVAKEKSTILLFFNLMASALPANTLGAGTKPSNEINMMTFRPNFLLALFTASAVFPPMLQPI